MDQQNSYSHNLNLRSSTSFTCTSQCDCTEKCYLRILFLLLLQAWAKQLALYTESYCVVQALLTEWEEATSWQQSFQHQSSDIVRTVKTRDVKSELYIDVTNQGAYRLHFYFLWMLDWSIYIDGRWIFKHPLLYFISFYKIQNKKLL